MPQMFHHIRQLYSNGAATARLSRSIDVNIEQKSYTHLHNPFICKQTPAHTDL